MARFSNARGIVVDRGGVGGLGPRRRVTVDAAISLTVHSPRLSVSHCLKRPSQSLSFGSSYHTSLLDHYSRFKEATLSEIVQRSVLSIQPAEGEPEENPTNGRQACHCTIVPY